MGDSSIINSSLKLSLTKNPGAYCPFKKSKRWKIGNLHGQEEVLIVLLMKNVWWMNREHKVKEYKQFFTQYSNNLKDVDNMWRFLMFLRHPK